MIKAPLVWAYGLGVDSTAGIIDCYNRGIIPDAILFADTRGEKQETYDYLPHFQKWLRERGLPPVTVVVNEVKNFKHWPPYDGLEQNCLTNGTLPSLAFGFKSCSLKWKVAPQNAWTREWEPAKLAWAAGLKVRKMIGYDAGSADMKRYAHARGVEDPSYEYSYPLAEQGIDREGCKEIIRKAGLVVPPKSACVFCPATKPDELHGFRRSYLRRIVIMEARAKPRLLGCFTEKELAAYNAARLEKWKVEGSQGKPPKVYKRGEGTAGLWRSATKSKPAMMTDYIRTHGLLPSAEIDELITRAPKEIISQQESFANGETILNWHEFLEQFSPEAALEELPKGCAGCLAR